MIFFFMNIFRQFLRLGNPLCCYLNDVTVEELESGKFSAYRPKLPAKSSDSQEPVEGGEEEETTPPPFGGSLSLARIQSLVSMTTPRDGCQPVVVGAPPFVEFDLSIDGFGCLFLPSIFPISEVRRRGLLGGCGQLFDELVLPNL